MMNISFEEKAFDFTSTNSEKMQESSRNLMFIAHLLWRQNFRIAFLVDMRRSVSYRESLQREMCTFLKWIYRKGNDS